MQLRLMTVFFIVMLLVPVQVFAQDDAIPQVTVLSDADGITVSDEIESGLVTVSYENAGEAPLFPILLRLAEDVTLDDFFGGMAEGPDAIPNFGTLEGGVMVFPQDSAIVTYNFEPGEYVLMNLFTEEPQVATFSVADSGVSEIVEPEHDVLVGLYDFAFGIPLEIPAGDNVWRVENFGMQWHEMAIIPIDPEMSINEVRMMLMAESEDLPAYTWSPSSEGEVAWLNVELEPGTYAVACFLPDISEDSEGHLHLEEGMLQIITVVDSE